MASLNPVTGALGTRRSAHILRRATFGPNKSDINNIAGRTANQAITELFQVSALPAAPTDYDQFKSWWIGQMLNSGRSMVEKMVFFYHTHFTTKEEVVQSNQALYHQNELFRYYALGNFKELTRKVCLDNAMMIFLDGRDNDRNNVNENFGRELLELYTIGKGPQTGPGDYTHYTEQDVKEELVRTLLKKLSGTALVISMLAFAASCDIQENTVEPEDVLPGSTIQITTVTLFTQSVSHKLQTADT